MTQRTPIRRQFHRVHSDKFLFPLTALPIGSSEATTDLDRPPNFNLPFKTCLEITSPRKAFLISPKWVVSFPGEFVLPQLFVPSFVSAVIECFWLTYLSLPSSPSHPDYNLLEDVTLFFVSSMITICIQSWTQTLAHRKRSVSAQWTCLVWLPFVVPTRGIKMQKGLLDCLPEPQESDSYFSETRKEVRWIQKEHPT